MGRAALLRGPPHVGACWVRACPPRWSCVVWWCLAWVVIVCWVVVGVVLFAWPGLVLCGCVPPPPPFPGSLCLCVPPPMVGCAVLVCAPPPWWGVLRWFVGPLMVGRAVLVQGPPLGGACFVDACPLRWWYVVRWCFASVVVVCWVAVPVVLFAWPRLVLCRCAPPPPCWGVLCLCVPPPLVGRAVSVCSGFGSWCFSRLDARLVLLVRCCLRHRMAGVVGCLLCVVPAWPGRTGRPPERLWCTNLLSRPVRKGRPLERVRCATPCLCFAGVVAPPLVFPCPPAVALYFRCLWPWHLFGWVSFSPLGSRPFMRSVRCALVPCPPAPPRRWLLVVCGAPRIVVSCRGWVWAILCGARCFAAPCCAGVRVPCCVVC